MISADLLRRQRWVYTVGLILWSTFALASGKVTIGIPLEPPNLDPSATSAEATQDVVYQNVYEGLTQIAEDGTTQPSLATHWNVSADGMHYRFFLRSGVRFHDGNLLSSEDVRWSLERARDASSTNPLHGLLAPIEAIRTPDERTVDIDLSRPLANLTTILAWGNLAVMSPVSAAQATTHPIGTGPFRFVAWHKGDSVVLERNTDYWGKNPSLDEVTYRVISDATSALASLLSGDVDAYPNFPVPEALRQLSTDSRYTISVGSTEGETLLAINNARPPFDDLRVRRALAHAVDRQAVINGAMYGYGTAIGSHFSPHDPAYVDLTGRYPYDPAAARALLKSAGYPNGFSVTLRLPPPYYARRSGEIIASQLENIGIHVRIENIEWAQWLEQVFKRHDYDLTIVSHTEPMDYDIYSRPDYYFGYHNKAYDERLDLLAKTLDEQERRRLLRNLQEQLADDSVNVWLFELPKLGVWNRYLTGMWREAPVQGIVMRDVRWTTVPAANEAATGRGSHWVRLLIGLIAGIGLIGLVRRTGVRFFLRKLAALGATVFAASVIVFILVQVLPGDAAAYMMGLNASPEAIHRLQAEYGLNTAAWQQYLAWFGGFLSGDLGTSYIYKVPVAELVQERLSLSGPLALMSVFMAAAMAVPFALIGARRPHGVIDRTLSALTQIGLSLPNYWLALMLIVVVSIGWQVLPAGGFPGWDSGLFHGIRSLILPACSLAVPQACVLARALRAELGVVLQEDYIRTARAKGASEWRVLTRHAFPNALIPTLTIMGLQFSFLIAGGVIVESIFSLPGIGRLLFQATAQRDLMVIRSVVLLLVTTVVAVNMIVELLWGIVDPRIRQEGRP